MDKGVKRILITGAGSYIGTSVERYLQEYNAKTGREQYRVDVLSLREPQADAYDYRPYDTVFHVAGKAHADVGHVSEAVKQEYYEVNCELAVRTALRAREQGVRQFIYMSSVIVYGDSAPTGRKKEITADTPPAPAGFYGDSKLQAEKKLQELSSRDFQVAIIRCPMVYGKNSKGNYPLLASLAGRLPVFPRIANERSMIYVENLGEFVRLLSESGRGGIFYPQNREYVSTGEMVRSIAAARGRSVHLTGLLNPFVFLASKIPGKVGGMANKAFGSLTISRELSGGIIDGYQIYSFEESIRRTER